MGDTWKILADVAEDVLKSNTDSEEIIRVFKHWPASQINAQWPNGKYCVQRALEHKNKRALRYLCTKGVSTDIKFQNGETALKMALKLGTEFAEIVRSGLSSRNSSRPPSKTPSRNTSRNKGKRVAQGSARTWDERVEDLMARYISNATSGMDDTMIASLLTDAQRLGEGRNDRDYDEKASNSGIWRNPIRMFRGRETLVGLMMLQRTSQDVSTWHLAEAVENSNETAFFYIAARFGEYPSDLPEDWFQYLPHARDPLIKGSGKSLQCFEFPAKFLEMYRKFQEYDTYASDQETLEAFESSNAVDLEAKSCLEEYLPFRLKP